MYLYRRPRFESFVDQVVSEHVSHGLSACSQQDTPGSCGAEDYLMASDAIGEHRVSIALDPPPA